jgi:hypothetical protein
MTMLFLEIVPALLTLVALMITAWLLVVDRQGRRGDLGYARLETVPVWEAARRHTPSTDRRQW